jgi:hypothetical protein
MEFDFGIRLKLVQLLVHYYLPVSMAGMILYTDQCH